MIRSMPIAEAPDGPALEILGEASHVRRRGDEDWTHCQELITWAGKLALGRLKPTLTMPDEVWYSTGTKAAALPVGSKSRTLPGTSAMLSQPALTPAFRTR